MHIWIFKAQSAFLNSDGLFYPTFNFRSKTIWLKAVVTSHTFKGLQNMIENSENFTEYQQKDPRFKNNSHVIVELNLSTLFRVNR